MTLETHKMRATSTCHDAQSPCQSRGGGLSNPSDTHGSTEVITSKRISSREKMGVHIVFMLRRILGTCITQYHIPFLKAIRKWFGVHGVVIGVEGGEAASSNRPLCPEGNGETTCLPTLFELDFELALQFETGVTCIKRTESGLLIIYLVNLILH